MTSVFTALVLFISLFSPLQSFEFPFPLPFSNVPQSTQKQDQSKTPVVICPGFGNDAIDYLTPLKQPRETSLIASLERRGFAPSNIFVVPIQRWEWLQVARGLLDVPNFYTGDCLPTGLGYGWYLKKVKETVDRAYDECGGDNRVLLVGHSAGGWLARAAMGDGVWSEEKSVEGTDEVKSVRTADRICCLVTIGAIHQEPSDPSTCVTKGALFNTNRLYPGAFLKKEGVGYVSVGGGAVKGNEEAKENVDDDIKSSLNEADDLYSVRGEGSAARVAYTSYKAVAGEGNLVGDGVVPLPWTQLEGSEQIELEGVVHSINEAGTTIPSNRWYGSENVVDRWLPTVLKEAGIAPANQNR